MTQADITMYVYAHAVGCMCSSYLTDSEYICPYCFRQTMYQITLENLERWLNYGY
jgi:hypothetical protein